MEAGKVGKFKQYVVTVIPAANVARTRLPLKLRPVNYQAANQQVKVVSNLQAAQEWVDKVAAVSDHYTVRRWKPKAR